MEFDEDSDSSFVFELEEENEGGFYRVPMTNRMGEFNRPVMVNRGEKFQVAADLLDVAHGTMEHKGDEATLLIASFHFLPSQDKRFVNAAITWTFTSDDPAFELTVEKLAPDGVWSLAPIKQSRERSLVGNASVGPALGPITASIGGEFGMKQTTELDYHTEVTGSRRMVNRQSGGHNAVRWTLAENEVTKKGICSMLQVGVLLRRTIVEGMTSNLDTPPKFRGELEVVADKGGLSEVASKVRRVFKKPERDEAIVFQPGINRNSRTFDINTSRLGDLDLQNDIMFMSLHQSFDKIHQERQFRANKKQEEEVRKREEEEKKKKEEEKKREYVRRQAEEERKQEEEEKKREGEKKREEEERRQEEEGRERGEAAVAYTAGSITTIAPVQGLPSWMFLIGVGIIGMYLWQHIIMGLFNGN
ncbi:hypothetical protein ACHAQJ_000311 [Trichoderma viride]